MYLVGKVKFINEKNTHLILWGQYSLNALAIATFARTATKGTTIMPDPSRWHISTKVIVLFPILVENDGIANGGRPGSISPEKFIKFSLKLSSKNFTKQIGNIPKVNMD